MCWFFFIEFHNGVECSFLTVWDTYVAQQKHNPAHLGVMHKNFLVGLTNTRKICVWNQCLQDYLYILSDRKILAALLISKAIDRLA